MLKELSSDEVISPDEGSACSLLGGVYYSGCCGTTQISSLSLAHSFAQGHRCWWRRTQSKSLLWNCPPLKGLPPWGQLVMRDYSQDQCGERTAA